MGGRGGRERRKLRRNVAIDGYGELGEISFYYHETRSKLDITGQWERSDDERTEADLASHVYGKVDTSTGVRHGSRHENVRGLWLLLGVTGDGVRIEENLKDKRFWLCFPCEVNDAC